MEWHKIVVWDAQGENCEKYLAKGSKAAVEGRMATRSYEDKDGETIAVPQKGPVAYIGGDDSYEEIPF